MSGLPDVDLPAAFFTRFWIVWLVVTGGSFAVVQTLALLDRDPGDTLSEHAGPAIQSHTAAVVVFTAFMAWLWVHWAIQRYG